MNSDGNFCQNLVPIYSPYGPILEFEVACDRKNFIDFQKVFSKLKVKLLKLKKIDFPYFYSNALHSLFSDCTVSAKGLKSSNANGKYAQKSIIETEIRMQKYMAGLSGLLSWGEPGNAKTAEMNRRKLLVRQSPDCIFYSKFVVDFFTCDRHLLSGITLCIAIRRSIEEFVIMSDDAAKQYEVKIVEANLYVRKMNLKIEYFRLLSLPWNTHRNVTGFNRSAQLHTRSYIFERTKPETGDLFKYKWWFSV